MPECSGYKTTNSLMVAELRLRSAAAAGCRRRAADEASAGLKAIPAGIAEEAVRELVDGLRVTMR
eukprot:8184584-Lingulodinium_polyedra.AAC.1